MMVIYQIGQKRSPKRHDNDFVRFIVLSNVYLWAGDDEVKILDRILNNKHKATERL